MAYLYLAAAIVAEVIGTTALQASAGFSKTTPTLISYAAYGAAFYFLSQALLKIPVGVAYAVWSGVGIVLIALIGVLVFRQRLDLWAIGGMALIVAGVLMINLLSKSVRP